MIGILAALVARCVFPREHPVVEPERHHPPSPLPPAAVPPSAETRPGLRAPPLLFPHQDDLLVLLTEIARRHVAGKEPEHEHDQQ